MGMNTDEGPIGRGYIPTEWHSVKLGEISSFKSGDQISVSKLSASSSGATVPVYGGNGIAGFTAVAMTNAPTLVIGRVGQRCGEVYYAEGPAWITDNALFPRMVSDRVDLRYLAVALRGAGLNAAKNRNDLPLLTQSILNEFSIPLPSSKAEQAAIVEALSDADALIDSLELLVAKKRQIKLGAMQDLLTGRRRLPGFIGKWESKRWGDVISICTSGATPYRGRPEYYGGNINWISSGELNYNTIFDTAEKITEEGRVKTNLRVHPVGTFLMAITGLEAAGTRGACGIIGVPATTNQSCMAIYPTAGLRTEYLYHYYVLRGDELALQYCQGTKQQSYTAKLVRLLPIDLPPTAAEQSAIAAVLTDMDDEIAALEAKLEKARQIKQGMMQELLTGRIRLV